MDLKYAPSLTHEGLDTDSVGVFVDALVKSVQSGVIVPTKNLQRSVLTKLRAPTTGADEAWDKTEEMQEELMEATKKQQEAQLKQVEAAVKQPAGGDAPKQNQGTPEKVTKVKEPEFKLCEIKGVPHAVYPDGSFVQLEGI